MNKLVPYSFVYYILFTLCVVTVLHMGSSNVYANSEAGDVSIKNNTATGNALVRVGFAVNYGFLSQAKSGEFVGFGQELLQEIAEHTGWKYDYVRCDWSDCLDMLAEGSIDLLGPLQHTNNRAKYFDFPFTHLGFEYGGLFTLKSREDLFFEDFAHFNGLRVAVVSGSFYNRSFATFQQKHGFQVEYVECPNTPAQIEAIKSGRADAFVTGSMAKVSEPPSSEPKMLAKFTAVPFFMATTKGNQRVLEGLNRSIRALHDENIYFDAALHTKYYKDDITTYQALTREEHELLLQQPRLKLGYIPSWISGKASAAQGDIVMGISQDIMGLIQEQSGLSFEYIPFRSVEECKQALSQGSIDSLTGFNNFNNSNLLWSESLLEIPMVALAKKDTEPTTNLKIMIQHDSPSIPYVSRQYPDAQLLFFDTSMEALQELLRGNVHIVFLNAYLYSELSRLPLMRELSVTALSPMAFSWRIGLHNTLDPRFLSIINKSIDSISSEEINRIIFYHTVSKRAPSSIYELLKENLTFVFLLSLLFFGLVALFYIHSKNKTEQLLKQAAFTDPLTGLWNLKGLSMFQLSAQPENDYAYVAVDINNFKMLNEYFDYETGNDILRELALELQTTVQKYEAAGRVSGDLFALLLVYSSRQELVDRLEDMNQRVLERVSETRLHGYNLTLSYGIYLTSTSDGNTSVASERANIARTRMKNTYKTTYSFYDTEIHKQIIAEHEIERRMQFALDQGEFLAYFQPKYSLQEDKIIGAEALARWQHPQKGLLAPAYFVPLFERNSFILQLDLYILELVCKKIRAWIDQGLTPLPIAVNMSKLHILSADFVPNVTAVVLKYGLSPNLIELELTETAFMDNTEKLTEISKQLQKIGFALAMDDFGSGYSSLNMLKEIPVQVLKIDRAFFCLFDKNERARSIVIHVLNMAKSLRMKVVSEGVETLEQVQFLKEAGCDMAQGYYFARPLPVEDFERLVFPHPDAPKV